jgi:heparanase 1
MKRMIALSALITALASSALSAAPSPEMADSDLSILQKAGEVDPRFLSYNIEMVEVTGGRFWRPYGSAGTDRYEYRPALDLSNRKLRLLASALAPAFVRYSGTWANAVWFADSEVAPAKVPEGFDNILTRPQWRGAVDFAKATGSAIVTSFATSPGTRDAKGMWQTDTAARWLAFTHQIGGRIAAAEFANEPNMISLTKPPAGYTAEDYRRDYTHFGEWLRQASPGTLLLAPGYAELGEPTRSLSRRGKTMPQFEADELITPVLPRPDAFTFHFYGGGSERCGGAMLGHSRDKALSAAWLDAIDPAIARMKELRDRVTPGALLWDTESGETACGGNPWASTFIDSFRFVDTLGRSARQGVRVFMHNTLAASDYALLDEHDFSPRPNYWAAVLWKRTMGTTVLTAPRSPSADVRIYAHCLAGAKGGVGLAAINLSKQAQSLTIGGRALSWTLAGQPLDTRSVTVNGQAPSLRPNGTLAGLTGRPVSGTIAVPGQSIVFVRAAGAGNPVCR